MRPLPIRRLAGVVLLALVAACDGAPSGPARAPAALLAAADGGAQRDVRERLIDLDGLVVELPCGPDAFSESVRLHGQIVVRQTRTFDGAGHFHMVEHAMPVGLGGVGLASGAAYRVSEREHLVVLGTQSTSVGTYRYEVKLSAPEIGVHGRLVLGGHYTANETGGVVVEHPTLRGECRT
jgi:hypothetical protein